MCHFLDSEHRTIYNMCTQKPPHDYSQQLYDKYREAFEEYINSTVRNIIDLLLLVVVIGIIRCRIVGFCLWGYNKCNDL